MKDYTQCHIHYKGRKNPFGKAFLIGIILNSTFVIIEAFYGIFSHSLALLTDAVHNACDVLGLVLAWIAVILSKREPSARYTFGLQSSTILAALSNAVLLLLGCGAIMWEAVLRFEHPDNIDSKIVILVAGIGVLINTATAYLFRSDPKSDLNIYGAFMHMASDAMISLGVVIAGILMMMTSWMWLDPCISIIIASVIIFGTWNLLKDSFNLALLAVPKYIDIAEVRLFLEAQPEIAQLHDLHIWGMNTSEAAMSAHIIVLNTHPGNEFLKRIADDLAAKFRISHCTIQIEIAN